MCDFGSYFLGMSIICSPIVLFAYYKANKAWEKHEEYCNSLKKNALLLEYQPLLENNINTFNNKISAKRR